MNNNKQIAAVGDRASIIIFNTAGISTYAVSDAKEAETTVRTLAADGCKIIFISEKYTDDLADIIDKYRESAYPAIIPIPDRSGTMGVGQKKIKANMEKAIGTDIFDK